MTSELDTENQNSLNQDESLESLINSDMSLEDKLKKLEEQNQKLYARTKNAENENKELKSKLTTNQPILESSSREEIRLIAEGYSDADISMLTKISKLEGVSLAEAKNSDLFKAYAEKNNLELRRENSRFGVSKGSSRTEPAPQFSQGQSRDDHKKAWADMMGN